MRSVLKWLKETYVDIPTNPNWIFWVIIACSVAIWMDTADAKGLWLEINGVSKHSEDTYHDGWEKEYGPYTKDSSLDFGEWRWYTWKEKRRKFNEVNLGAGLQYDFNDYIGAKAGFFDNSFDKLTVYSGLVLQYKFDLGPVNITPNITGGFVTGYDDTPVRAARFQLTGLPAVAVGTDSVRLNIGYIPGKLMHGDEGGVDVITAQLQMRVW